MVANVGIWSLDYNTRDKWRPGWLSDDHGECVVPSAVAFNSSNITSSAMLKLTPLESFGSMKALVLKWNETTLVAEMRSKEGINVNSCTTVMFYYTLTMDLGASEGPIRVLYDTSGWRTAIFINDNFC
ncbi:secreted protein [Colletotrichum orchidophilum]|uniref:Secreted protein n=1 Tax=Colletotrichum orchidophilum TaxID=1209926 RepID=A0A1G4B0J7_9PEZI|nr:uncharacterized protein CORC01_09815 [Colletotrichum orchidophilum]OHE94896.1 secreted protein [Colletotrichum orchidophilum]